MLSQLWGLAAAWVTWQSLLVGVTVFLAVLHLTRKRYRLPPGPRPLPLLGNTLSFRNCKLHEKLYEWSKQYGPIVTFYFGPSRCVALNDLDSVTEALLKKPGDFAGRPHSYMFDQLTEDRKDIAMADYGPTWKIQRRLGLKALRKYMTGTELEKRAAESLEMVCQLMTKEKGAFDLLPYMSYLINSLLCGVLFGKKYDMDDPNFKMILSVFQTFSTEFGKGLWEDVIPPLRLFPTRRFRNIMAQNDRFYKYLRKNVEEHTKSFDPENIRDMTDALLLEMQEDQEFQQLSDEAYFRQTIRDLYLAGLDTSRHTLHFALFHMAAFPAVQQKVQAELDSVLGNRKWPGPADKASLPYTEATLHESMRLGSIAPVGVPHKALKDTTLGDYEVPRDTMVLINHWALHHDQAYWDAPQEFRPERFLDEEGKMAGKPAAWLPFSMGRRVCLGETVARPELLLLFAGLMKNFTYRFPEGEEPDVHASEGTGFGLQAPPFKAVVTPRP